MIMSLNMLRNSLFISTGVIHLSILDKRWKQLVLFLTFLGFQSCYNIIKVVTWKEWGLMDPEEQEREFITLIMVSGRYALEYICYCVILQLSIKFSCY